MAGDAPGIDHEDPASPGVPPVPLALYRKYRPATFAEVKGQEHVTEPLRQALRSGRINHAYLFSGPRGCGKTSSARILARSLNCEQGPTPDPCGQCASCVALAPSGPGSIDVIEIDAASHGGVDDARDLRERAFYAPVSGRFKIYIIDEAHMVTAQGFNALLKLVEEPPPHLKFVFATTEPEKVIATIRSRTHHYAFRLVPPAVLRSLLEEILAAERIPFEPAVLPLVVRAGAGSARDSLSVLDQLLAGATEEGLTYERTAALLGYTDDSLLEAMIDAFATGDGAAVFGTLDRVMEAGYDPRRFASDLLDRLRDLIILAAVPGAGDTGLLDAHADRLERMTAQVGRFGQTELTRAASTLSDGLVQMRGATSPRLLLELACAQILLPGAHTDEKSLLARLERLERRLDGAEPTAAPEARPPDRDRAGDAGTGRAPARSAPARSSDEAGPGAPRPAGARPPAQDTAPGRPVHTTTAAAAGDAEKRAERRGAPRAAAGGSPGDAAAGSGPAGGAAGRAAAAVAGGAVDVEVLRQKWPDLLDAVNAERKVARILLQSAEVHSLENAVVTLAFAREGESRAFSSSDHAQVVERVLSAFLGRQARVKTVLNPSPGRPAGSSGQGAASRPDRPPADAGQRAPAPPPRAASPRPEPGDAAPPPSAPSAGRQAHGGRGATAPPSRPPTAEPKPPASTFDENEWPDDEGEASGDPSDGLTGMDLIRHQLGGEIIAEIDEG